jgi:hypothetical protein
MCYGNHRTSSQRQRGFSGAESRPGRTYQRRTDNDVAWNLAGKNVRIRFLGREYELNGSQLAPNRIEKLGYLPQDKTIRHLSECGILYCPYFFDEKRKEISKTSFPSKLSTYLAAGKPIFYHGPGYGLP